MFTLLCNFSFHFGLKEFDKFYAGTNNSWRNQSPKAQAMSATTRGNLSSSRTEKNEPDHLLVLVHGILAR